MSDSKSFFDDQIANFRRVRDKAAAASLAIAGRNADLKRVQASTIFAMLCAASHSVIRLLPPISSDYGSTIDHGSICSLCRNLIEGSILLSYATEDGISDKESRCRQLLFCLHDCGARVRLFKGIGAVEQYQTQKATLAELREDLSRDPFFLTLPADTRERALTGTVFYIRGLRSAAVKAGWSEELFDGLYGYLSSHPHFAPMSHFGMNMHSVDYKTTSNYQMMLAGIALEQGGQALAAATDRIVALFPITADKTNESNREF